MTNLDQQVSNKPRRNTVPKIVLERNRYITKIPENLPNQETRNLQDYPIQVQPFIAFGKNKHTVSCPVCNCVILKPGSAEFFVHSKYLPVSTANSRKKSELRATSSFPSVFENHQKESATETTSRVKENGNSVFASSTTKLHQHADEPPKTYNQISENTASSSENLDSTLNLSLAPSSEATQAKTSSHLKPQHHPQPQQLLHDEKMIESKFHWFVDNLFSFENIGFGEFHGSRQHLLCANCDYGPVGWHDKTCRKAYYIAIDRVNCDDLEKARS